MSLQQKQIIENTKKYFDTATKLGFMNEELMAFLGEEFIKAPASTMEEYHNPFEGGLIDHLLKVAKYAVLINKSLPDEERVDQNSLVKTCLLHQIGKAKLYTPCKSEWHRKNQGKMYEFVDGLTSMRSGERSVYYATSFGVKLTEEEYIAIVNFDKMDDRMSDYHNSMVGELLKMGSVLAIKSEQAAAKIAKEGKKVKEVA
jgi:hypothetical protein